MIFYKYLNFLFKDNYDSDFDEEKKESKFEGMLLPILY